MDPVTVGGYVAAVLAAAFAWFSNRGVAWRDEAEAQKARADRLEAELTDLRERVSRVEIENRRLGELASAQEAVNALREDIKGYHADVLKIVVSQI